MLANPARGESDAMRALLATQERSIRTELEKHRPQLSLERTDPLERAAWLADTQAMRDRLDAIVAERATEPRRIEELYEVPSSG